MSVPVIRVQGLGKRYRLGQRVPYKMLRDTMKGWASAPWQRRGAGGGSSELWALKDVSFDVKRGEVLGIIGANGVGKSTLLKILSRITEPSEGFADVRGRVGSLLEVGTGFHPELTGRENIFLNGAILGMTRREITKKFDTIVQFAGVERFIDTPVKHYSSGMYVRLAFSVAAHYDPEILLIDEVLAVGDAEFQQRCLGKMSEVVKGGRTILFVSHNMTAVRSLCSRVVLLREGCVGLEGSAQEVIQTYLSSVNCKQAEVSLAERKDRGGNGRVRVTRVDLRAADRPGAPLSTGWDAEFVVGYASQDSQPIVRLQVVVRVDHVSGWPVFGCTTRNTLGYFWNTPPAGDAICRIKQLPLLPGTYSLTVMLKDDQSVADLVEQAASFTVIDAGDSGMQLEHSRQLGSVVLPHEWVWAPAGQGRDQTVAVSGLAQP